MNRERLKEKETSQKEFNKKALNTVFNHITGYILLITCIGLAGSFLTDYLIEINWFGDTTKQIHGFDGKLLGTRKVYGTRHHWYIIGMGCLFFVSILRACFNIVALSEELNKKNEN